MAELADLCADISMRDCTGSPDWQCGDQRRAFRVKQDRAHNVTMVDTGPVIMIDDCLASMARRYIFKNEWSLAGPPRNVFE